MRADLVQHPARALRTTVREGDCDRCPATGDRGEMMRTLRMQYLERDPPLPKIELINVLLITNAVEETFFLLSKIEKEFNPTFTIEGHVPHA